MSTVNSWWTELPHERFWLAVNPVEETKDALVIPEQSRSGPAAWVGQLPACLPARDVIFHYDPIAQTIGSWSRSHGPAKRKESIWARGRDQGRRRSEWVIELRGRKALEAPVSIADIARVQWEFFPALRAFEEKHGDPLYYPFAMGRPDETHPLPGHLFKLPSLFVESFPSLASVAHATRPAVQARAPRRSSSWWEALENLLVARPKEATRVR